MYIYCNRHFYFLSPPQMQILPNATHNTLICIRNPTQHTHTHTTPYILYKSRPTHKISPHSILFCWFRALVVCIYTRIYVCPGIPACKLCEDLKLTQRETKRIQTQHTHTATRKYFLQLTEIIDYHCNHFDLMPRECTVCVCKYQKSPPPQNIDLENKLTNAQYPSLSYVCHQKRLQFINISIKNTALTLTHIFKYLYAKYITICKRQLSQIRSTIYYIPAKNTHKTAHRAHSKITFIHQPTDRADT